MSIDRYLDGFDPTPLDLAQERQRKHDQLTLWIGLLVGIAIGLTVYLLWPYITRLL